MFKLDSGIKLLVAFLLVTIGMLTLISVTADKPDTFIRDEMVTMEIRYINRPKHFYLDLKYNNEFFLDTYVSKWCSKWKHYSIGDSIQVRLLYMRDGDNGLVYRKVDSRYLGTTLCNVY